MRFSKIMAAGLCAAMLVLTAGQIQGAIYVSKTQGSNQNSGAKDGPVQEIDRAIALIGNINAFLQQEVFQRFTFAQTLEALKTSVGGD